MSKEISDGRFAKIQSDPRFKKLRKRDKKVKIDARFNGMFSDDTFNTELKVDRYGRKLKGNTSNAEDYAKFYRLEENSQQGNTGSTQRGRGSKRDEDSDEIEAYRGGDITESEGSSDFENLEEDSAADLNQEVIDHEQVLDQKDIPSGEATNRFAVVNLDWDHIRAVDLMKLFDSIRPSSGAIRSVRIYPSEFGLKRMKEEIVSGPPKDVFLSGENSNEDAPDTPNNQKLRRYQLERLRYFFAVVECDSVKTAAHVYGECDGMEYMHTGNILDIRYIPDSMSFESQPKDTCDNVPAKYQPMEFLTTALQSSKVDLSWDDDDPKRIRRTKRKFTKEDILKDDLEVYVAPNHGSESDLSEAENPEFVLDFSKFEEMERREREQLDKKESAGDVESRYRNLLGITGKMEESNNDGMDPSAREMEITFTSGLSSKAENLLTKIEKKKKSKEESVFDRYIRERKEKKKARTKNELVTHDVVDDSNKFRIPHGDSEARGKRRKTNDSDNRSTNQESQLELLMMDDGISAKKHFNLKSIMVAEEKENKRKTKRSKFDNIDRDDAFELNANDPRFQAIFESSQYAIDPTHPSFRKTKGMELLMQKRQIHNSTIADAPRKADSGLGPIVQSIKQKSSVKK